MKVYSLGFNPFSNCILVKIKNTFILFDCGLELTSILKFLPDSCQTNCNENSENDEKKNYFEKIGNDIFINGNLKYQIPKLSMIDFSVVDVILISNYQNILALPYISEYTKFEGKIYATEPTITIGRYFMEEYLVSTEKSKNNTNSFLWQNKNYLSQISDYFQTFLQWKELYSQKDIDSCIEKMESINYSQHLNIHDRIQITGVSSGYCLGGTNWIISTQYEKITYISESSMLQNRHPAPLDFESLRNSDVMILSKINTLDPRHSPETSLAELCNQIGVSLNLGGNILIPTHSCGILFDLLDYVNGYLKTIGSNDTKIYFISPVAEGLIAYSEISGEWLCNSRRDKIFVPEPPFRYKEFTEKGILVHYPSIFEESKNDNPSTASQTIKLKQPCIVFCGHPSCRMGDVQYFIKEWGQNKNNSICFIEPDFDPKLALAPFQPLQCNVTFCPIDPCTNFQQLNTILSEVKPRHIVRNQIYTVKIENGEELISGEFTQTTLSHLQTVKIPLKHSFERALISANLSKALVPSTIGNYSVCGVSGMLVIRDHNFELRTAVSDNDIDSVRNIKRRKICGSPTTSNLYNTLTEKGINCVLSEQENILLVESEEFGTAKIEISPDSTTSKIETKSQKLRKIIRDCILSQCKQL